MGGGGGVSVCVQCMTFVKRAEISGLNERRNREAGEGRKGGGISVFSGCHLRL